MASHLDPAPNVLASPPPEASPFLTRLLNVAGRPLERFLRIEAASGVLLLLAAAAALVWANLGSNAGYSAFWHTPVAIRIGSFSFERSLEWVVNDGLMVVFFFVVGLEIRREIHCGELSEWRRAALPAMAALGGMLAPAGLYLLLASAPTTRVGWGVPMATDIAFAVGILTLLGKRVPPALRVLLLALAVIDDLGAIVVIALFYSAGINYMGVLAAAAGLVGILMLQRIGVRTKALYLAPGLVAWAGTYAAGIHPTIAGVLIGLMTPVRAWLGAEGFVAGVRDQVATLEGAHPNSMSAHDLAGHVKQFNVAGREALSPAESLIQTLHPWVAFGIMPLFALANAGVALAGPTDGVGTAAVSLAVGVGLVLGKPAGVLLAIWVSLRTKLGRLPTGIGWRHLLVLGTVAGVGFTMALFIAQLAFQDASLLNGAKLGVLAASAIAGVLALLLGLALLPATAAGNVVGALTADEAEASTEH